MRAHIIDGGRVINTIEISQLDAVPGLTLVDASLGGKTGDLWDGEVFMDPPEPPPDPIERMAAVVVAIQEVLDAKAKERGYDSIFTLCTYADDPDPVFAAEGVTGKAWRSAVWAKAREIKGDVMAGTRPLPAVDEVIAELPVMVWPEV